MGWAPIWHQSAWQLGPRCRVRKCEASRAANAHALRMAPGFVSCRRDSFRRTTAEAGRDCYRFRSDAAENEVAASLRAAQIGPRSEADHSTQSDGLPTDPNHSATPLQFRFRLRLRPQSVLRWSAAATSERRGPGPRSPQPLDPKRRVTIVPVRCLARSASTSRGVGSTRIRTRSRFISGSLPCPDSERRA